ncbi:MAG: hypothetical protein AMXMBFR84_01300 [Candidatus Hydrogenedentota bacterium]
MIESFEREALELAAILDTMADGVFVIDNDHRIQRWNRAMQRLTGYSSDEAYGQPCSFLKAGDAGTAVPFENMDCELFARGEANRVETVIARRDGTEVPVIANGRVLRDADGEAVGAVITLTDISPVRELQEQVSSLQRHVAERYEFHSLIGKSRPMQELYNLVEMAAASNVTVLVYGETGTGKELVAKAIHFNSDRRGKPIVTVNCSALSESLLESELFGHVKGAFTGAIRDNIGRFERADGGTIFLDEIGEIPPLIQVKLLRVLQERELERVGESISRRVDVRIIAATNKDLLAEVKKGNFREDLYYRLKVFPVVLPPLRERKEDMPLLLNHFIGLFRRSTNKDIRGFSPEAMRIMMDYCWPGNVRELENAVEHAFVTCPGPLIGPFDLPLEIRRMELRSKMCAAPELPAALPYARAVRHGRHRSASKDQLIEVLRECDWNKAEAARRLGLTRTSVWRRMKALGIPLEPGE